MQPIAQKSSQSPRPPCWRVLTASCSRRVGHGETLLRLHLDEGQVIDLRLGNGLAKALGLQPAILGVAPSHKAVATGQGRAARPERIAQYRAAWQRYISDPALSQYTLAEELQCSQTTLASYFRSFGQEPGAPQLRPNGKL